jgi:hypothetical protein
MEQTEASKMTYANYETRTIEIEDDISGKKTEKMVFDSVDAMYKYLKQTIKPLAREKGIRPQHGGWPFIFKGITK